ncbi:MAG: transposase, partial [Methylocella sp.]
MQWSSIKGRLPGQKRRRPRRGDDRRVIRGIIDVLQPCMRWRECPKQHRPSAAVTHRWHRWPQQGLWQRLFDALSQIAGTNYGNAIASTAMKVHRPARRKKGAKTSPFALALCPSRGGGTTKVPAGTGRKGRPLRFLLSGGQCFDGKAAAPLPKPLPPPKKPLAGKAYDCAAFRGWRTRRGTPPVILRFGKPSASLRQVFGKSSASLRLSSLRAPEPALVRSPTKINRRKPYPHKKRACRHRNRI